DRGSFRELSLALEGLESEGFKLSRRPRAPPRAVVPFTTRPSGRGPLRGCPSEGFLSKFVLIF
ncbi:hypothetical protein MTR67_012102, partial [Solanum verrucosum]